MTPDQQLALWRYGIPIHNLERDECCPDFSCCQPSLLAPEKLRIAFCEAGDDEARWRLLMFFLGACIGKAAPDSKAYIAGDKLLKGVPQ